MADAGPAGDRSRGTSACKPSEAVNHYEVLQVSYDVSAEDAVRAYRRLSLRWHGLALLHNQELTDTPTADRSSGRGALARTAAQAPPPRAVRSGAPPRGGPQGSVEGDDADASSEDG